jgi:hypothetical protein
MTAQTALRYRYTFKYDPDPDLSYIEDTEEGYQHNGPFLNDHLRTSRPELRRWNGYRIESDHGPGGHHRSGRIGQWYVVRIFAPHGGASWLRLALPGEVEMTWEDYRDTYGDKSRYVSFGCIQEKRTPRGTWGTADSIWGLDFYDYGPDPTPYTDEPYTLDEIRQKWEWIADHFEEDDEPGMSEDDFSATLAELLAEMPISAILAIPGVYEAVSEELNNDVLARWEQTR